MQPIFDNLNYLMRLQHKLDEGSIQQDDRLFKDHLIELEALTYIRGRSIPKQYIVIDEAQN